jgi:hypothetical protein
VLQLAQGRGDTALFEEGLEQLALGGEVVVDGGVRDAGRAGDIADAGARESLLGEEAQ